MDSFGMTAHLVLMDDAGRSSGLLAVIGLRSTASDVERCDDAESRPPAARWFDVSLPAPLRSRLTSASLSSSRLESRTPCSSSRRVSSAPNPTSRSGRRSAASCGSTDASSTRRTAVVSTATTRCASSVVSFLWAGCRPSRRGSTAASDFVAAPSVWTSGRKSFADVVDVVPDFIVRSWVDSIVGNGIASVILAAMTA